MEETITVQEIPPVERLLALDTLLLWRVVLAMLSGYQWFDAAPEFKRLYEYGGGAWLHLDEWDPTERETWEELSLNCEYAWDYLPYSALPDPLSRPDDAWDLEERQLDGYQRSIPGSDGAFCFGWWLGMRQNYGPWHLDRKRALCLAVLHKHANGPLETLITPLLERINKEGLDK